MTNMKFDDLTFDKNPKAFAIMDHGDNAVTFGYRNEDLARTSVEYMAGLGYRPFGFWRVKPSERHVDPKIGKGDYWYRTNNKGESRIYRKDVP